MTLLRNVLGTIMIMMLIAILFWWVWPILIGIWAGLYLTLSPLIVLVILPIVLIIWLLTKCKKKKRA